MPGRWKSLLDIFALTGCASGHTPPLGFTHAAVVPLSDTASDVAVDCACPSAALVALDAFLVAGAFLAVGACAGAGASIFLAGAGVASRAGAGVKSRAGAVGEVVVGDVAFVICVVATT